MFSIETASSMNVADVYMASKRSMLYGVVELNPKESHPTGAARRILAGGVGVAAGVDEAGWPSAMAEGVASAIDGLSSIERPSHIMGAFLSMSNGVVRLCWAGTIRAHLIRRGAVVRVTRDHNLIDDPVEGVTDMLLSSSSDVIEGCRYVPSRTLEQRAACAPEIQVWEVEPRDVLLICSVYIHRNAAPSDYVQKLTGDRSEMLGCDCGFITVIHTGPPVG